MSAGYVCECCRAMALRTAHASLDVLGAEDITEATHQIAAQELCDALEVLHHVPGLRVLAGSTNDHDRHRIHAPEACLSSVNPAMRVSSRPVGRLGTTIRLLHPRRSVDTAIPRGFQQPTQQPKEQA